MSRGPAKQRLCRHRWREQLRWSFRSVSVDGGEALVEQRAAGSRTEVCTRCGERREVKVRRVT